MYMAFVSNPNEPNNSEHKCDDGYTAWVNSDNPLTGQHPCDRCSHEKTVWQCEECDFVICGECKTGTEEPSNPTPASPAVPAPPPKKRTTSKKRKPKKKAEPQKSKGNKTNQEPNTTAHANNCRSDVVGKFHNILTQNAFPTTRYGADYHHRLIEAHFKTMSKSLAMAFTPKPIYRERAYLSKPPCQAWFVAVVVLVLAVVAKFIPVPVAVAWWDSLAVVVSRVIGKWDVGYVVKETTATYKGFDTFLGYYKACNHDLFYHTEGTCSEKELNAPTDMSRNVGTSIGPEKGVNGTYSTRLFTHEALTVLSHHFSAAAPPPLYMYLAPQNVHLACGTFASKAIQGIQAPCSTVSMFPHVKNDTYKGQTAVTAELDFLVGNVTQKLQELKQWNNTVVIFTSDNGGPLDHTTNYHLRGGKHWWWQW